MIASTTGVTKAPHHINGAMYVCGATNATKVAARKMTVAKIGAITLYSWLRGRHAMPGSRLVKAPPRPLYPGISDFALPRDLNGVVDSPRYRTVLSIFWCPRSSCAALRFPVRRYMRVTFVRLIEWVANFSRSRPIPLTHSDTRRAYWRVVNDRSAPRRPRRRNETHS